MNREVCGICWCPYDDNGACGCKPQTGASMNREDILRMAREAGLLPNPEVYVDDLERFAALVAAAEREACAKVCEEIEETYQRQESIRHPALRTDAETGSGECAAAIRARSNT